VVRCAKLSVTKVRWHVVLTHISNTERSFHYVNAIPTTETKTPLRNAICITYTQFPIRKPTSHYVNEFSITERYFHYVNAIRTTETKTPLRNEIITYAPISSTETQFALRRRQWSSLLRRLVTYSLWLLGNQSIIFTARRNASAAMLALQALY